MPRKKQVEQMLTVDEAAEILRVVPHTVYRWIWAGKLRAAKAGWIYRISREDLNAFLFRQQPAAAGR